MGDAPLGRAAIVGVGGLGAPAALVLAGLGARLSLIDPDVVELSNLPRQPLYGTGDLGRPKVEVASERLRRGRPGTSVKVHVARLDERNAAALLQAHDVVVDGTDGLSSKDLLNRVALELRVPLVHAGAIGLDGQLMTILPGRTACLRCLFVELSPEDELPTCQQAGVLGPVVGAVGLAAAREAAAVLRGHPPPLAGRLGISKAARCAGARSRSRETRRVPTAAPRAGCAGRGETR